MSLLVTPVAYVSATEPFRGEKRIAAACLGETAILETCTRSMSPWCVEAHLLMHACTYFLLLSTLPLEVYHLNDYDVGLHVQSCIWIFDSSMVFSSMTRRNTKRTIRSRDIKIGVCAVAE